MNGAELCETDVSPAGTTRVKDINPGTANSSPANLTNVGGTLYFAATDGANGAELWKRSDDPPGATR